MTDPGTVSRSAMARRLVRSWFELTRDEQRAILVILGLVLLGLAVRIWHQRQKKEADSRRPPSHALAAPASEPVRQPD
jgi:hypothetical protein